MHPHRLLRRLPSAGAQAGGAPATLTRKGWHDNGRVHCRRGPTGRTRWLARHTRSRSCIRWSQAPHRASAIRAKGRFGAVWRAAAALRTNCRMRLRATSHVATGRRRAHRSDTSRAVGRASRPRLSLPSSSDHHLHHHRARSPQAPGPARSAPEVASQAR